MEDFSHNPLATNHEILEGIIRLVQFDILLNDYVAWLDFEGDRVIIPRQELELYEIKSTLNHYIGMKVQFKIMSYDEQRRVYLASCKEIKKNVETTLLLA